MVFRSARLKLKRANEHIRDLDRRIEALPDTNIATVEINPDGGNEVIKHDFPPEPMDDIALVAGDAIHNLKCALDYTWLETIRRLVPSAVGKFAKFPVYPSPDELEAALRGKQIDVSAPHLFNVILNEIKPYDGGNLAAWPVHRLDIRDKHRLLIPVIRYASITGIATKNKRTGETTKDGFTFLTDQEPPLYIPMPPDVHVTDKGKIAISVMFNYGSGAEFRVTNAFDLYLRFIFQIVERLEIVLESG